MTIELTDAVNGDGLFDILGKYFHLLNTLNIARATTIPTEATDALNQLRKKVPGDLDLDRRVERLAKSDQQWRFAGSQYTSRIRENVEGILIAFARADANLIDDSLETALRHLIDDMVAQDAYVDPNVVSLVLAENAGNSTNDLTIAYTQLRGDGRSQEQMLVEVIELEVTAADDLQPQLSVVGDEAARSKLSEEYPAGSGTNATITATPVADSLLTNGDFETETLTDIPDGWFATSGTIGSQVKLSDAEVQKVTIAGSPTSGYYLIQWDNHLGLLRSTLAIAFDASSATFQAALRTISGLEAVTVVTTGTSPNFVHTITMTGVTGDPALLVAVDQLDTGTVTPSVVIAAEASIRGKSLLIGNNPTSNLHQELTLLEETTYFLFFNAKMTSAGGSGKVVFTILDEIGGNVLNDSEGTLNRLDLNASSLTTSSAGQFMTIRLPKGVSHPVYLKLNSTIAESHWMVLDDMTLIQATELYPGGPYVAAFPGIDPPIAGDKWTLTVSNNFAGEFQTHFDRAFDMTGKGILLPVSGATLINDSLIA